MSRFLADLCGGLSITRAVLVAVAVFVLFGTGVDLAFDSLTGSLLAEGASGFAGLSLPALALILSWLTPVVIAFLLTLFMIEIAAVGADRRSGKDVRMQLAFKPDVAWALLVSGFFSLLIVLLLSWLLSSFLSVFLASAAVRTGAGDDADSLFSTLVLIGFLQHLLSLIALAFGVSRFALIPIIARHHGVGFREAWKRQTHGFDHYYGSLRNRFFRVFLALLLADAALALAVTRVMGADLILYPVSVLLITVLPVAVATHMVRSQPVPHSDTDEVAATDAENPGEGDPE